MDASQDAKSYIANYVRTVRDMYMRSPDNPLLDGPIPGQSLTTEPGNRPWENPPKLNTVEEAIDFYMKRLSDPEMMNRMLDILEETELPITVLVEVMTMGGVMQGLHSVDISVLVSPVLVEFIKGAADKAEIEYTLVLSRGRTQA